MNLINCTWFWLKVSNIFKLSTFLTWQIAALLSKKVNAFNVKHTLSYFQFYPIIPEYIWWQDTFEKDSDFVTGLWWCGTWPDIMGQADLLRRISHLFTTVFFSI